MIIRTNVGKNRKLLISKLSDLFDEKPQYEGAPGFAYRFSTCMVDRDGALHLAPTLKEQPTQRLADILMENGIACEVCNEPGSFQIETEPMDVTPTETVQNEERYTIRIPHVKLEGDAFARFQNLVESKRPLICKVLSADDLPIRLEDGGETIALPWFEINSDSEERAAYKMFIDKLVALANQLKRARLIEKAFTNEKYAFRCFLLRLGFIGKEYKSARAILTRNLEGNSAFLCGYDPRANTNPTELSNLPMIILPSPFADLESLAS